jgi:hypothetical protein
VVHWSSLLFIWFRPGVVLFVPSCTQPSCGPFFAPFPEPVDPSFGVVTTQGPRIQDGVGLVIDRLVSWLLESNFLDSAWGLIFWWHLRWFGRLGMAKEKKMYWGRLWALPNDSKHNEECFSTISADSLCLLYESLRCLDLEICQFLCWRQTSDRQILRQTDYFTPAAHVRTWSKHIQNKERLTNWFPECSLTSIGGRDECKYWKTV